MFLPCKDDAENACAEVTEQDREPRHGQELLGLILVRFVSPGKEKDAEKREESPAMS